MRQLLTDLLDIILPPTPERRLIRSLNEKQLLETYQPGTAYRCQYLAHYRNPAVKALIKELKFHQHSTSATHLATLVQRWLQEQSMPMVFIPVPLSRERMRERGFNQVTEVLRQLPEVTVEENFLVRTHHTPPQSHLPHSARAANVHGAFSIVSQPWPHSPSCMVVLVDDVVTTGATMAAARASLAPHIPPTTKLICLALAH